jgi:hypothetical protein
MPHRRLANQDNFQGRIRFIIVKSLGEVNRFLGEGGGFYGSSRSVIRSPAVREGFPQIIGILQDSAGAPGGRPDDG